MEEDIKTQNLNSDNTEKPSSEDDGSWILDLIDLSGLDDWPEHLQSEAKEMLKRMLECSLKLIWTWVELT